MSSKSAYIIRCTIITSAVCRFVSVQKSLDNASY